MPEISSPEVYFTQVVPQQYAAAGAVAQPDLTALYVIEGGGSYGLRALGSSIEVLPAESVESPDMRTVMSYDDWKTFAESGETDPFVDYIKRGKAMIVKGLKGAVQLELAQLDGGTWRSTTVFGDQEEPAVMLQMTEEDHRAMLSGELNSQMAFLTGKLKFEGSLPLLMQIGALTA